MKKLILAFVLGFIFHKGVSEEANYRVSLAYEKCISVNVKEQSAWSKEKYDSSPSPYKICKSLLDYNKVEKVLLYQPNFWCGLIKLGCQK